MTRACLVFGMAVVACGPRPVAPAPAASRDRVVVISVDGMMPDVYLNPDAHGLAVPTLRALQAAGATARVRGVMPTVTYPSHTTLVTGVPPSVHGIVSNKILDPLDKSFGAWRWYAEDIKVPTIYEAVERAHGVAAMIAWPVTVGAHASVVVPEYWRAGGPEDQKLLRALSTPGLLDEVAHGAADLWMWLTPPDIKDHGQMEIARYVLETRHPDLVMIHIFELDDAQHEHGPWSPEAKSTIEAVDRELGSLLAYLQRAPQWPHTRVVVLSDHGFAPVDHEMRLPALFLAHHLIRTDADGKPTEADVAAIASGGTALIYVLTPARRADIDAALHDLGDHVVRRIEHDELVRMGGDPQAAFALVAAPGYQFSDIRSGDVIVALAPRGTHGWPPDDQAMASSFIAFGPAIPHVALGTIDMTSIAPTLARWLGVALPTATGAPLAQLTR